MSIAMKVLRYMNRVTKENRILNEYNYSISVDWFVDKMKRNGCYEETLLISSKIAECWRNGEKGKVEKELNREYYADTDVCILYTV